MVTRFAVHMHTLSSHSSYGFRTLFLTALSIIVLFDVSVAKDLEIIDYPILTTNRLELTRKYAKRHYDMDTYLIKKPKMIVIHYTAVPSLEQTLTVFKPDYVPSHRSKLATYGEVNVGTHFVVGFKGEIYSLIPTTVMARHVIGFNHVALGIENVSGNEAGLTDAQLEANAQLIAYLTMKHPSIKYMIGHLEYMNKRYPHAHLYKAKDPFYQPYVKIDPGTTFMRRLRKLLKEKYDIVLEK